MKKILFLCIFIISCSSDNEFHIPKWLGGWTDHRIYENRCGLYNFVFSDVKEKLNIPFDTEESARLAVLNLVNKLYKEHERNRSAEYRATLYYLYITEKGVYDYEFFMDALAVDRALLSHEKCTF